MTGDRTVLVTGASGFVGRATVKRLRSDGWRVRAVARQLPLADQRGADVDWRQVGDIDGDTDWSGHVAGCDAVVHLAARVHVLRDSTDAPLAAYRRTNVDATRGLAEAAARAGVRRMLFLSSLKVNGEGGDCAYGENDAPAPADAYAISKHEAEVLLQHISAATGMEIVILRPPLVYGPGVKANFLRLLQTVNSGVPLPFASISNRRSLIFLGNLVDAIALCLNAPAAAGNTYLVSDGEDVSTPTLVRAMASALQCPTRLLPCPIGLLHLAGRVFGRQAAIDRVAGSLRVDSQRIRRELQWVAPFTLAQGMEETARWFRGDLSQ